MMIAQLIGPTIFLLIGVASVIAGAVVPAGSLTDDGHPLGPFLMLFGGGFSLMGLIWGALAFFGVRQLEREQGKREALRQHVLTRGTRLEARVTSCKCDGYLDMANNFWTDIELEYELPGIGKRRGTVRKALSQAELDRARAGGTMSVMVDPGIPSVIELAP